MTESELPGETVPNENLTEGEYEVVALPQARHGLSVAPGHTWMTDLPKFSMPACRHHFKGHKWWCGRCDDETERQFRECAEWLGSWQRAYGSDLPPEVQPTITDEERTQMQIRAFGRNIPLRPGVPPIPSSSEDRTMNETTNDREQGADQ